MMTTCAIMIGGMLSLYSSVNDRLRLMARERLDLLRMPDGTFSSAAALSNAYSAERLHELDRQIPTLLRRHQLTHNALLAVYGALAIFVATMLVIALGAVTSSPAIANVALIVFLGGTVALLLGAVLMGMSIRTSQDAVDFEARRVLELGK
jgi:hypothetical protein